MKLKNLAALTLSAAMTLSLLTACGGKTEPPPAPAAPPGAEAPPPGASPAPVE